MTRILQVAPFFKFPYQNYLCVSLLPIRATGPVSLMLFHLIAKIFVYGAIAPTVSEILLIFEDMWSQTDTPHSVGLLWTSDQPNTETSTIWLHTTLTRNRHPCHRRESNPQYQKSSSLRPLTQTARPLGSADVWYYRILISASCNYLESYITSSTSGPSIFLSLPISNIFSLTSFLNIRSHVTHPYKRTGKITVLYILIFMFVQSKRKDKTWRSCVRSSLVQVQMMTNKMRLFWFISLFLISSTRFGRCFGPSSGALDCKYR